VNDFHGAGNYHNLSFTCTCQFEDGYCLSVNVHINDFDEESLDSHANYLKYIIFYDPRLAFGIS